VDAGQGDTKVTQEPVPEMFTNFKRTMLQLELGPGDLNTFLVPDDSPLLKAFLPTEVSLKLRLQEKAQAGSQEPKRGQKRSAGGELTERTPGKEYCVDHLDKYQTAGLSWPPDWQALPDLRLATSNLSDRQAIDILC
jgi:hypothetical protein